MSSLRTQPYSLGTQPSMNYDPDLEYLNIENDQVLPEFTAEQQQILNPRGDTYLNVGYQPETLKQKKLRILGLKGCYSSEDEHYHKKCKSKKIIHEEADSETSFSSDYEHKTGKL